MLRLTGSERAVAEICAASEHMVSLTAAAAAFRLEPDVPREPSSPGGTSVKLLDESTAPEALTTLSEIKTWASEALGVSRVPNIWRVFAHHPELLDVTWHKNRLIFGVGTLDELTKACTALAVAQYRSSSYWISYQEQFLRHSCGFDDRTIVEVTAMMMHSVSFNTIAHGMRLEPPFEGLASADFELGGPPGPGSRDCFSPASGRDRTELSRPRSVSGDGCQRSVYREERHWPPGPAGQLVAEPSLLVIALRLLNRVPTGGVSLTITLRYIESADELETRWAEIWPMFDALNQLHADLVGRELRPGLEQ